MIAIEIPSVLIDARFEPVEITYSQYNNRLLIEVGNEKVVVIDNIGDYYQREMKDAVNEKKAAKPLKRKKR